MIKVKLQGHEYRYEIFQIISLFYEKNQIVFDCNEDCDLVSILDSENSLIECKIFKDKSVYISEKIYVNKWDKKQVKNALKLTALKCLTLYTGKIIPWGILVGIRPTKIVHELLKKCLSDEEIIEYLTDNYKVASEKAKLALEVAKREAHLLEKDKNKVSMYIGIPFCPTRCVYCSFTSNPLGTRGNLVEPYIEALCRETETSLRHLSDRGISVDTLYIGGGTPTSLSVSQLEKLFNLLKSRIDIKGLREFTVEAGRPDSFDEEKLRVIKESGCSRISINPQTMNDLTLRRIGRNHTSEDIIDKFNIARKLGFNDINMDLIIGLPGEGIEEIKNTMEALKKLQPESITIHTMAVKRGSVLNEQEYKDNRGIVNEMYELAVNEVRNMGLKPYYMYRQKNMVSPLENIGYCVQGRECIYNIQMIAENITILSLGADGVTKLVFDEENRIERVANLKDVSEYIVRIDEMIENKIKAIDMIK